MESTLRDLVAKIAETKATFPLSANMRDELKVDSVRVFELVFEIERTFDLKFPEERFADVVTFDDLVTVVRSLKSWS